MRDCCDGRFIYFYVAGVYLPVILFAADAQELLLPALPGRPPVDCIRPIHLSRLLVSRVHIAYKGVTDRGNLYLRPSEPFFSFEQVRIVSGGHSCDRLWILQGNSWFLWTKLMHIYGLKVLNITTHMAQTASGAVAFIAMLSGIY